MIGSRRLPEKVWPALSCSAWPLRLRAQAARDELGLLEASGMEEAAKSVPWTEKKKEKKKKNRGQEVIGWARDSSRRQSPSIIPLALPVPPSLPHWPCRGAAERANLHASHSYS